MTCLKRRVVLLGGRGFIGGFLFRSLEKTSKASVIALHSENCDLLNPSQVSVALGDLVEGADVIFCSSTLRYGPHEDFAFERNVTMVRNFLGAIQGQNPRQVIFLSSSDVYGTPISGSRITESTPTKPLARYGLSKLEAEGLMRANLNCPVAVLRLPGVYGPGDRKRSVIGSLTNKIRNAEIVQLTSGGNQLRDYVHVSDLAEIIWDLLEEPRSLVTNIATGKELSLRQLTLLIGAQLGLIPRIESVPPTEWDFDLCYDISGLLSSFPGHKPTLMQDGIANYLMDES